MASYLSSDLIKLKIDLTFLVLIIPILDTALGMEKVNIGEQVFYHTKPSLWWPFTYIKIFKTQVTQSQTADYGLN